MKLQNKFHSKLKQLSGVCISGYLKSYFLEAQSYCQPKQLETHFENLKHCITELLLRVGFICVS